MSNLFTRALLDELCSRLGVPNTAVWFRLTCNLNSIQPPLVEIKYLLTDEQLPQSTTNDESGKCRLQDTQQDIK